MDALTCSAARANMAHMMDRVCNDHEPLIITRNGEQVEVMLSLEDYKALEETACLLRNPMNVKRLLAATERRQRHRTKIGLIRLIFADSAWEDYLHW